MLHTLALPSNLIDNASLLKLVGQNDAVLLWQDGVVIGLKKTDLLHRFIDKKIPVFALINDVLARGLSPIYHDYVHQIDMRECAILTEQYYPQFAWY